MPRLADTELPTLPSPSQVSEREEVFDADTPWHVVLLDDDFHTYDYVVEMLMMIFGYEIEKAYRMTVEVDTRKRVIVWTGHLEKAEAFQGEIHDFGADWRMESSKGSMSAVLEPAR